MAYLLRCGVQDYEWGSRTLLPAFLGREPDGRPHAELWVGAHPSLPSAADVGGRWVPLDQVISAEPRRLLGDQVVNRFGAKLPMLVKVLAVDAPLSLQAHPSQTQARVGFDRELAVGASLRSYVDADAKPEMVMALTTFSALGGFRPVADAAASLEAVAGPLLSVWANALRSRGTGAIRQTVGELLTLPRAEQALLVAEVAQRVGLVDPTLALLAERYPTDAGVIVAALLRRHTLRPGDAVFVPAGALHTYLGGLAVEVQASSDNVLRGGLTSKRVDVHELLQVLEPDQEVLTVQSVQHGFERTFPAPNEYFATSVFDVGPGAGPLTLGPGAPALLLALDGHVEVRSGTQSGDGNDVDSHILNRGGAVFVGADEVGVTVRGRGSLLCATPPINP